MAHSIEVAEIRLLPSAINGLATAGGDAGLSDDQDVDDPQQVAGAFLTSTGYGDPKGMSFNDIYQGGLDTCVFASTLAGAARSSLNLASRITELSRVGGIVTYRVQLFSQNASGQFVQNVRTVVFDGTMNSEDLKIADEKEYWPAIFQRAYLGMAEELGKNYRSLDFAFGSIYGALPKREAVTGTVTQARAIKTSLEAGSPVSVDTIDHTSRFLETRYGLLADHAYTVIGMEVPTNGDLNNTFVSLRNTWGYDTARTFFTEGHAQMGSWGTGVDGANDGLIRIPWSVFAAKFAGITTSTFRGGNINNPVPENARVVFNPSGLGPFTVFEGQALGLTIRATDPDGDAVFYSLDSNRGYINPLSGEYYWEPPTNSAGQYTVRVRASTSVFDAATLSFTVNVLSGTPRIASLQASPTSIKNDGSDLLTLTAQNVVTDVGMIDGVEFWKDVDGNGIFNASIDSMLGEGVKAGNNWSWSGYVGGLTVGSAKFFARARRFSFQSTFYSTPKVATVTVTQAPTSTPVAIADAAQVRVTSSTQDEYILKTATDAAGNVYHLTLQAVNASTQRFLVRKLNPAGTSLMTPVVAETITGFDGDADLFVKADGTFAVAWRIAASLKLRWYAATGEASSSTQTLVTNAGGTTEASDHVQMAGNANGDLFITYNRGDYFAEDVWALSVARNGTVSRAAWRVNSNTTSMQRSAAVALNADGNGVITWHDAQTQQLMARSVSQYGVTAGAEFVVASTPETQTASAAVAADGRYYIAWSHYSTTVPGIMLRQFTAGGGSIGSAQKVNTFGGGSFSSPQLALSTSGWMTVAWTNTVQDGTATYDPGVYAQVFDASGAKAGPEFAVPGTKTAEQWPAGMLMDADADLLFSWNHGGFSYTGVDFGYVRRFTVDLPPEFSATPTFTLPENSPAGTSVGSVQAVDPEATAVTYSIPSPGPFAIDSTTGAITVANSSVLDFEQLATQTITVRATSGGKSTLHSVTINLTDVNDAPVMTAPDTPAEYFTTARPTLVAPTGLALDVDSANFSGGTLTVSITGNRHASDRLQVVGLGSSGAVVQVSGSKLLFGGLAIGTFSGGTKTTPLVVKFNAAASAMAVQAVLRQIGFSNTSTTRTLFERTVTFVLADGDGGTSAPLERQVRMSEFNRAPTVTGFTGTAIYTENAAAALLAPSATVTDLDSVNFEGGQMVVALTAGATGDDRLGIRHVGSNAGQIGISGTNLLFGGVLIGTMTGGVDGSPLVVQFNAAASQAAVTAVLRNVTFSNVSDTPATIARTAQVTISDGDGGQVAATKLANVKPVNDAPTLTSLGSTAIYSKAVGNVLISTTADVVDADSVDFAKGKLTVALAATNRDAGDRLSIRNQGNAAGQIGVTGNKVYYEGIQIGTVAGGTKATTALVVTLNANADVEAVTALMRNLVYSNISNAPGMLPRTISLTLSDGDGATSTAATKQIALVV